MNEKDKCLDNNSSSIKDSEKLENKEEKLNTKIEKIIDNASDINYTKEIKEENMDKRENEIKNNRQNILNLKRGIKNISLNQNKINNMGSIFKCGINIKNKNNNFYNFIENGVNINKELFNVYALEGVGNCYYKCLSEFLYGKTDYFDKLKKTVSIFCKDNIEEIYNIQNQVEIKAGSFINTKEYINNMDKNNDFANDIDITISSYLFAINIVIYIFTNDKINLQYLNSYIYEEKKLDYPLMAMVYDKDSDHFNLVYSTNEPIDNNCNKEENKNEIKENNEKENSTEKKDEEKKMEIENNAPKDINKTENSGGNNEKPKEEKNKENTAVEKNNQSNETTNDSKTSNDDQKNKDSNNDSNKPKKMNPFPLFTADKDKDLYLNIFNFLYHGVKNGKRIWPDYIDRINDKNVRDKEKIDFNRKIGLIRDSRARLIYMAQNKEKKGDIKQIKSDKIDIQDKYVVEGERLYIMKHKLNSKFKKYLIPFAIEIDEIMKEAHDKNKHCGIDETIKSIENKNYYWVSIFDDVTAYINKCETCSKSKDKQ